MSISTITTDRLVLDGLCGQDAAALFAYRGLPEVARFQSFEPGSIGDVDKFIARCGEVEFGAADTWSQLAVRLKESGELVGDLGLHFLEEGSRQVEIGFTIAPGFQRKGLGVEAVRGVLDFLFCTMEKHRVVASVDPRNVSSMALLRRLGLRQEAHFHESLWFKGEWVDDVVWAVLRAEWKV